MTDSPIALRFVQFTPADLERARAPTEHYEIVEKKTHHTVGRIRLRLSDADDVRLYAGHVGYNVEEAYRGHHYAAHACNALKVIASQHDFVELWITCDPDNWPSRRTCERIGAVLIEIIDLPEDNDMYLDGERQKCRYLWQL